MHRLLISSDALASSTPTLPTEAQHHLKVLRPKDGEVIELFDGAGHTRRYHYEAATRQLTRPDERRDFPPSALPVTLFACVTKGSRWDWTLEKATELGVTRIVPVLSARTIVRIAPEERRAKQERWQRVVEDAARQSDAVWLPQLVSPVDFETSLTLVRETTCFVGALTTPTPEPLLAAILRARKESAPVGGYAVYVGPEGDFTPEELAALLTQAIPTTFGPTILRAETAALFALSTLMSALQ